MKKADVELSYHRGSSGHPMINVKHHLWVPDLIRQFKGNGTHEFSDDAGFWAWLEEQWDTDTYDGWEQADEWARESCWEAATELAHEIWPQYSTEMIDEKAWFPEFPPGCQHRFTGKKVPRKRYHVQVYSEGRSGGWLVVSGLDDVESWDAIALGRWARFQRQIETIRDEGYPYDFVWQLAVNIFEPIRTERRNLYPTPNYAGSAA